MCYPAAKRWLSKLTVLTDWHHAFDDPYLEAGTRHCDEDLLSIAPRCELLRRACVSC